MAKKVLFAIFDGVYPNKVGGMEIFNYYLLEALSKNENFTVFADHSYPFCGMNCYKSLPLRPIKLFYPLELFALLLLHKDIKTVVLSFSEASWILWRLYHLVLQLLRRKYIVIIHHGKEPDIETSGKIIPLFKDAMQVVAVSMDIKKNYDKVFNINSVVIPPLVPFRFSEKSKEECRLIYNIPQDVNVICQIGTINEQKNPDTVLKALAMFSLEEIAKYKPYVVFTGCNKIGNDFIELPKKLGIEAITRTLGFVPKENIRDILKLSDIYLIASDYEGTSVSLLEAMYNSKPILASRVRGTVDIVTEGESAMMFEAKNPAQLKELLIKVLSDREAQNQLAQAAYLEYSKRFSYQSMLDSYLELFKL